MRVFVGCVDCCHNNIMLTLFCFCTDLFSCVAPGTKATGKDWKGIRALLCEM